MAQSVNLTVLVDMGDNPDDDAAEQFLREILSNEPRVELVEVTRTTALYER